MKIASGEIIFLCDSDDFFAEKKIENIIKKFEDNNESKIIFDLPIYKYDNNIVYKKLKKKFYKSFWPNIFPTSCIAIKREDFVNNFAYLSCQEFPDIWLDFRMIVLSEYIYKDNTVYLNENLTYYRQTKTSISSKFKFYLKFGGKEDTRHMIILNFFLREIKLDLNPTLIIL